MDLSSLMVISFNVGGSMVGESKQSARTTSRDTNGVAISHRLIATAFVACSCCGAGVMECLFQTPKHGRGCCPDSGPAPPSTPHSGSNPHQARIVTPCQYLCQPKRGTSVRECLNSQSGSILLEADRTPCAPRHRIFPVPATRDRFTQQLPVNR